MDHPILALAAGQAFDNLLAAITRCQAEGMMSGRAQRRHRPGPRRHGCERPVRLDSASLNSGCPCVTAISRNE